MSLREFIRSSAEGQSAWLKDVAAALNFRDLSQGTVLPGRRHELAGKSVLIATKDQLNSALALIELDGLASRLVICLPDVQSERLASVIHDAQVEAVLSDETASDLDAKLIHYLCSPLVQSDGTEAIPPHDTEWVMLTSGTTGKPKLVAHTLEGLLGAILKDRKSKDSTEPIVWGTFYDIRRYGGLQIFLRALTGGSTMVMSHADEPLADYVARCREAGVTHMSGTPSHWRRLLMSPHADTLSLNYVRLSGEIADRAILDALRSAYPEAHITHAYASTEAGVAFDVTDGLEGFPASLVNAEGEVELRIEAGSLRIRSPRTAKRYVGRDDLKLFDQDGFVDTDDMVELSGDRYFFKGRRTGIINIGGQKVHPEEVEEVINRHPAVRMSLVKARNNPILGSIIVANVVLKEGAAVSPTDEPRNSLRDEILTLCRDQLDSYKIPAMINFVTSLDFASSGKIERRVQ
ncbi:MAG: fatty acid--CoA ligase family protein [Alphaproteobacteria bacterium]|nr:fatty acid--CoA ligase family protein [Alphaproteobacteria bacterium]